MKTEITKHILWMAALISLWGCSSDSEDYFHAGDYPLVLSAQVEGAAMALSGAGTGDIGIAGIFVSGGTRYHNALYTGAAGILTPVVQGYWASTGSINIYAYAPHTPIPFHLSVNADQRDSESYTGSDFLYASPKTFAFADRDHISLTFKHHLSKVSLALAAGEGITPADLAGATVEITGTNTAVNIDITNGTLGILGGVRAITPGSDGTNKYKAIVIPQTIASGTTLLRVTIGARGFEYALPAPQEFKGGEQYNYTLTLSQGGVNVSPVEIVKWEEEVKENNGTAGVTSYKVGDYYPDPDAVYQDGMLVSGTAALGVVCWLDPSDAGYESVEKTGLHGKLVSLDENSLAHWGAFGSINAEDPYNGMINMNTLSNHISSEGLNWTDYPPFDWVHAKNEGGTSNYYTGSDTKGVWYLPSISELQYLYCAFNGKDTETWFWQGSDRPYENYPTFKNDDTSIARDSFNQKLTAAGGTAFNPFWHTTSSEAFLYKIYEVDFSDGASNTAEKDVTSNARAFILF